MSKDGFIKFLGTAGARFVMIRQLRSSAGIWVRYKSTNIIIDPGPGAIVRCNNSRPSLDPTSLDGIILTHKHLDHSGDLNVMIEAMTEGGFRNRGKVFCPKDAVGNDGVLLSYLERFPQEIVFLQKGEFSVNDIKFSIPGKNRHSVETYGLRFDFDGEIVSFISDTAFFDDLVSYYKGSHILVVNVVFFEPREEYEHLSIPEAVELVKRISPRRAILTHFGMSVLRHKPHLLEQNIHRSTGLDIKFAYDGMSIEISSKKS